MQIDFHYDVIYVLACYAGFRSDDAALIAHCSQYVDEADTENIIKFSNYNVYYQVNTAHEVTNIPKNSNIFDNILTWVPFHFLPGNSYDVTERPNSNCVSNLICRENSQIAQEMMDECINNRDKDNGLHRLGISLHVFADTWAHQNFAGIEDEINCTNNILDADNNPLDYIIDEVIEKIADTALPLGHGTVGTCPDLPYLKWSYTDYLGKQQIVDNCDRFVKASREIYKYLRRYLGNNTKCELEQLPVDAEEKIRALFTEFQDKNGHKRHLAWQEKIKGKNFLIDDKPLDIKPYQDINSWYTSAVKEIIIGETTIYETRDSFINSNWNKFQTAAKEHRDFVLNHLLPKYNLL